MNKYNILIKGIDMQNAVELEKNKQRYKIMYDKGIKYQFKKRKSIKLMQKWKNFFKESL